MTPRLGPEHLGERCHLLKRRGDDRRWSQFAYSAALMVEEE